jgi:hypothetical protein
MFTFEQKANNKARVEILSDIKTWNGFDASFNSDLHAKQLRETRQPNKTLAPRRLHQGRLGMVSGSQLRLLVAVDPS